MNRTQRRADKPRGKREMQAATPMIQALFSTALRFHQAGHLNKAERLYRQVLTVNSHHVDSLHLLGVIAQHNGHHDLAVELIGKAITISPREASYHSNLGTALWKQGQLDAAIACYRRALELRPDYAKAHFNLATVLWKQGRPHEADAFFRSALHFNPNYPEARDNLGSLLKEQGRLTEAIACYREAIGLKPDYAEAHNNLGTALLSQGHPEEAVASYRKSLDLRPDYPEAHFNLGTALTELGQPDAAVACYRNALALRPDYADAHHNLGAALKELGQVHDAIACYRTVLTLEPDHPEAHSNLGIALLAQGELAEGWEKHEWRWRTPQMIKAWRDFPQPRWRGEAVEGRTLLIHAEQGFGDTLQFCRYAPLAAERGPRVIMEVQPPLVRLLRSLSRVELIVGHGERLPEFDLHCPMLSLPLALGTTLATIPAAACYLRPDPAQIAVWRSRLGAMAGKRTSDRAGMGGQSAQPLARFGGCRSPAIHGAGPIGAVVPAFRPAVLQSAKRWSRGTRAFPAHRRHGRNE